MKFQVLALMLCFAAATAQTTKDKNEDKKETLKEEPRSSISQARTFGLDKLVKLVLAGNANALPDEYVAAAKTLLKNQEILVTVLVVAVPIVVIGFVIAALTGYINIGGLFSQAREDNSYDYDYEDADYSSYSSYVQRSLNMVAPILTSIGRAYEKYERSQ